jgi:uncharacterized protein YjbI with pentapeptide repeats
MTNPDHLKALSQGVDFWNAWREREPFITPDLSRAKLSTAKLTRANLSEADLGRADLRGATLGAANLSGANLSGADLRATDLSGATLRDATLRAAMLGGADLSGATLRAANLSGAKLGAANLSGAKLSGADLSGAVLINASLVNADLADADLSGCHIFGVSAWALKLSDKTRQRNLIITLADEPKITVDNIEVAQFIYLMLNNQKIREVIDTITSKAVLILGRFTEERKAVLNALRDELRNRNYLPILFDFDKPTSQTTVETISLLARMARFVIADISDAKSVLQELQAIVPDLPSVPVQPVIIASQGEPGMFDSYRPYPWFLPVHRYDTPAQLLTELSDRVIEPAEARVRQIRGPHQPRL